MAGNDAEDELFSRANEQAAPSIPVADGRQARSTQCRGGEKELLERLGNNDPCPCGCGRRFRALP
jgi:hypothetical protein